MNRTQALLSCSQPLKTNKRNRPGLLNFDVRFNNEVINALRCHSPTDKTTQLVPSASGLLSFLTPSFTNRRTQQEAFYPFCGTEKNNRKKRQSRLFFGVGGSQTLTTVRTTVLFHNFLDSSVSTGVSDQSLFFYFRYTERNDQQYLIVKAMQ